MCVCSGEEARKLFNDAQTMLKSIVSGGLLKCHGVVGFYRAQQQGDDILILDEEGRKMEVFYGIRQQASSKGCSQSHLLCNFDIICPVALCIDACEILTYLYVHTGTYLILGAFFK